MRAFCLARIDQMIKKKGSDVELGRTYFAFDRCGLRLCRIDQMIKTSLVDSYFAFDRCGLLLGRIDQMIKKGSDVELGSDVLRRTLDNAVATNVRQRRRDER